MPEKTNDVGLDNFEKNKSNINNVENIEIETNIKENEENKEISNKNNIIEEKDDFSENHKKYLELLNKVENRKSLENILHKNTSNNTLAEKVKTIETFIEIENEIKTLEDKNLKNFLLSKIKEDVKIDEVKNYVQKAKKEFLQLNTSKSRIALGKAIQHELSAGHTIPLETKKNITEIFDVPNDLAMDLGLDLGMLKTDIITNFKQEIEDNFSEEKKLEIEQEKVQELIFKNSQIEAKANGYKNKIKQIEQRLKVEKDPENIKKLSQGLEQAKILYNTTEKEYKDNFTRNTLLSQNLAKKQIKLSHKIQEKEKAEIFINKVKEVELKENSNIEDNIKNIFIESYNSEKEEHEKQYIEKINKDRNIYLSDIKEDILSKGSDIEGLKKKLEDSAIQSSVEKRKKLIELEKKASEIDVETEVASDIAISDDDDFKTRMEKHLQREKAKLIGAKKKLELKKDILELNGENEEDTPEIRKEKRNVNKKIKLASSNIQTKIEKIKKDFEIYKKEGNYSPEETEKYELKIKGYTELKEKLNSSDISINDKKGMLALLGKGEWLGSYIKNRSENYIYNNKYTSDTLTKYKGTKYSTLGENKFVELYGKSLDAQKFALIEEFSKLKATIPNFDKVLLTDNIEKQTRALGINDDETLAKIQKLKELQDAIMNFNFDANTNQFVGTLEEIKKGKEIELITAEKEKELEFRRINQLHFPDLSEEEQKVKKDAMKLDIQEAFDKHTAEIKVEKEKIQNEINTIEEISKTEGKFKKNQIKDISNNIDLFSIVGNTKEYGDILEGISDEIIEGNTDFIDLESYKNIKGDFYTTQKLNELSEKQLNVLQTSIDNIPDNASPALKKYKRALIEEHVEVLSIKDKIKKGRILEDGVIDFLSNESLFKIKLQEQNKELIEQLSDPKLLEDQKIELKKALAENFLKIEKINKKDIGEALKAEILEETKDIDIDREEIQKELKDGFDNANTAKKTIFSQYSGLASDLLEDARDRWDIAGSNFKKTGKIIVNEISGNGVDIYKETAKDRHERHKKIDKYVDAVFISSFAYLFLIIPKLLNKTSTGLTKFPKWINWVKEYFDKNKSLLFIIMFVFAFLIVIFAPQSSFHFMNLNTHLYTVTSYVSDSGNIKFSDYLGDKGEALYYKANTFLFFIFLIVLYQIIIEFLHKYIIILKKPKVGVDLFMVSILKLVVFFIYMTIIFKVNTFIT